MKKIILAYMIIATAASAISVALKDTNRVTSFSISEVSIDRFDNVTTRVETNSSVAQSCNGGCFYLNGYTGDFETLLKGE